MANANVAYSMKKKHVTSIRDVPRIYRKKCVMQSEKQVELKILVILYPVIQVNQMNQVNPANQMIPRNQMTMRIGEKNIEIVKKAASEENVEK